MDDSFRRLRLVAAIAALGAGGAAAQSPQASVWFGDGPHQAQTAAALPTGDVSSVKLSSARVTDAPSRPTPLPAVVARPGSGVQLGMPTATVSMKLRPQRLALAAHALPMSQPLDLSGRAAEREGSERLVTEVDGNEQSHDMGANASARSRPAAASMTVVQLLRRSDQLTQEAEMALRRGAVHSARDAATGALRACAAAVDMRSGGRDATGALEEATTAVREVGDFVGRYGHVGTADLQRMVDAHQTPALKGHDAKGLSPQTAADAYLDFARERFSKAAGGRREAAVSLAVLARAERVQGSATAALSESVAITYMRAAVGTDPSSAALTNELGYQAMRLGLLDEAQWALERSWSIEPNEPALRNLIETHRLAGDPGRARQLVAMLPRVAAESASRLPEVVQVDPDEFAAISPPVQSPAAGVPLMTASKTAAARPVPLGAGPSAGHEGTAGAGSQSETTAPQAEDDAPGVLGRVAGAMRRMWQ